MKKIMTAKFDATSGELMALAQLVKRIGFREVRVNAVDEEETRDMFLALERLRLGLAEAGFSPR